ncbi:MAG: lysoplasmalogenase [Alistipes sp.]|nr:lysoplasmalogenase [Alistipes sp.]MDE7129507.1 lysoplasmalogenase [Alistipes sp.]
MGNRLFCKVFTIAFIALVAVYVLSFHIDTPSWFRPFAKTMPVLFLSMATWRAGNTGRCLPLIPLALLLSSMGDLAGDLHAFLWQIGLFAAAHTAYIVGFIRRCNPTKASRTVASALISLSAVLGSYIINRIPSRTESIFIIIYIIIITAMAISAVFQDSRYRWWYAAAAIVFIFSDSCIAWNRYVAHIPHATVWIMSTYFIAQYTIARLYLAEKLR